MPNCALRLRPGGRRHVIIAGGGFAAVEALLALRSLAGERVSLEIVSPDPCLRIWADPTGAPSDAGAPAGFPLSAIADHAGASARRDAVAAIAARHHRVHLASGAARAYDGLVLALGARRRAGVPGALTMGGERDAGLFRDVVSALAAGTLGRVAFAVPAGVAWTLPIYELALITARSLGPAGAEGRVVVVTPERRPLEIFGADGARAIEVVLAEHGVGLLVGARPRAAHRGCLELHFGGTVPADRVVAVPRLVGVRVPGLAADWGGFVETSPSGRVAALDDVYAAGDITAYPVKQGGLATQQADAVAHEIAALVGADVDRPPAQRVLRARLAGPAEPLYLHVVLDAEGRPRDHATVDDRVPWWPSGRVYGRFVSPYLARVSAAA